MEIQSLSVVVPNIKCINNCAFCVSKMHTEAYKNQMDSNLPFYDLYFKDYMKRLDFARDNGCNTVMLTGNSEPQQNRQFLMVFGLMIQLMEKPFRTIEVQTTGVLLDRNYLRFLRNHVGVNTISLSISAFDDETNRKILNSKIGINLKQLCADIKEYDFNLRLSINLNTAFDSYDIKQILEVCKQLNANQITFRILYAKGDNEQSQWILKNPYLYVNQVNKEYIESLGATYLTTLPYGAKQYSYNEMSVVIDDDCMNQKINVTYKYLILREDCKLYSKWDDKGSLIF